MDYYQGVVTEYLRANRATFVNTEFCINIGMDQTVFPKDSHWYCDAVALSFEEKTIYLCEVTFAAQPHALFRRLLAWNKHWSDVQAAVRRDGHLDSLSDTWAVKPWIFVPERGRDLVETRLKDAKISSGLQFEWKLTTLEKTQPWNYRSWDRRLAEPVEDAIASHV